MVDHTMEVNFNVSASAAIDGQKRAHDDRVVAILTEAIMRATPATLEYAKEHATVVYHAVMALPAALETARNELRL